MPNRFRPAAPKPTTTCLPLPEVPPKPKNDVSDSRPVPFCKSTLWPGAGKMSGNWFEDRNWLLLPNYLSNDNENKTESELKNTARVTNPRPLIKEEELKANDQEEREREQATAAEDIAKNTKTTGQDT